MPYLSSNLPLTHAMLVSIQGTVSKLADGYHFVVAVKGELELNDGEHTFHLTRQDLVLLPAGSRYQLSARGSNLVLLLGLRTDFFEQGQSARLGHYIVNSSIDHSRNYAPVMQLIARIAMAYFEEKDIAGLHLHELCYALLFYLNRYHFQPSANPSNSKPDRDTQRKAEILSHIERNYALPLTLQDLADEMHLSATYLSKYFKQHMGQNFYAYLSAVRLQHAAAELLNSDQPATAIAYNNGFSNINSFIRVFKEAYNTTPDRYRRQMADSHLDLAKETSEAELVIDHHALADIIDDLPLPALESAPVTLPNQREILIEDVDKFSETIPLWKSMINIGFSKNAADSGLRAQLTMAQQEIGFKYCRIQGILSSDLLSPLPGEAGYNFSEFDRFIEFLRSIGLTPFFDLSSRPHHLFFNSMDYVYTTDTHHLAESGSLDDYVQKLDVLVRHCVNTFGEDEVKQWGFEIGYQHDEKLALLETPAQFVERFGRAYRLIKELSPGSMVGGITHNTGLQPSLMAEILDLMDAAALYVDFISIVLYPYSLRVSVNPQDKYVISSDPDMALRRVEAMRTLLLGHKHQTKRLFVTVFGADVNGRNLVNDTCYQAAFFVKNTIALLGKVEMLGYWQLSDIETQYHDTPRILFGGNGLLSKDGIKKPGFSALKRMGDLSPLLVQKGDGYMVTTNARNSYEVVLHNYAHFNKVYCMGYSTPNRLDEVYTVFETPEAREVSLVLSGLREGTYKVTSITLNRENGSLLDEWVKYGMLDELQPAELQYFRDIIHPRRQAQFMACNNGQLALRVQMRPHEVHFFSVVMEV